MAIPNLTDEDIRVLQYVADRGDAGITTDRVVQRYRALAKAGLLEHRAVSLDAEWFGLSEQGRDALELAAGAALKLN
jgi:hypothetical protein